MVKEKGNISINTENIFPIIKKWLYSDKDIFLRELISNGCDAISKVKRLSSIGEAKIPEETKYEVIVSVNKENKTLKIIDNGIGMTEEEINKYINQVAFSGAEDFIAKYKDKMDESSQIIGHFGLGFYSAFMVSDKVEIDTLSYIEGSEAVKWICDGGTEYEITSSERNERGTTITLYISEDSKEFLEEYKVREVISKHCSFLPVEIFIKNENVKNEEKDNERQPLNDTNPLWLKAPKDCTEEEYKDFYRKVFFDFNEPLFWIHLNVDYPFNLKGILYFPKLKHEFEATEGQIKLYNNQVFVADNIKEVIPEFLLLLKGAIDCADLPLNVSRSFLQKDGNVKKISRHIVNKVADKLTTLYKNERDNYNNFWSNIHIFIKYGCLRDQKFYEKVKDIIIFKTIKGEYVTLKQYLEANKEKHENKVFYVNDEKQQAQYIKLFKENDLDAIILNSTIDSHFISFLESNESDVKFNRIDSDLSETLKAAEADNDSENKEFNADVENIFKRVLNNDKLKISIEALKTFEVPAMVLLSEQSRRMSEMSSMFGGMDMKDMFPSEQTLVINKNNILIKKLIELDKMEDKKEDVNLICQHIYDLAMISHKQLDAEAMSRFISRSNEILAKIAG
ncbi:molecular chaperone HtpG [Clostridium aciditolerans]|uniref:Molecular chaperone HtpG n=1 Tax=Clostridium aciditolerans TaxID=339861 RepID=A0A934M731_9CLOT|nr:molecular chaperone HtpG [Clostridium aciditolerans]MBI6875248.1 molecular chaperone HtpG [Clostridium aciditolerans]